MRSCVSRGSLHSHLQEIGHLLYWPGFVSTHQLWALWPLGAGFCASRIPSIQAPSPGWSVAWRKPRTSTVPASASPASAPRKRRVCLTFPCPSSSALHCVKGCLVREAGAARELPGALNCLACISQPLWGQLFLSPLWGLFADPLPTTLSPSPLPVPVQNCF